MKMIALNPAWCGIIIRVCALAAIMGLSAFTNAPAGTIGGTNADWNLWQEVAGLPAARENPAAGVLNNAFYAVGHN